MSDLASDSDMEASRFSISLSIRLSRMILRQCSVGIDTAAVMVGVCRLC